jgi:hypothetical protein
MVFELTKSALFHAAYVHDDFEEKAAETEGALLWLHKRVSTRAISLLLRCPLLAHSIP